MPNIQRYPDYLPDISQHPNHKDDQDKSPPEQYCLHHKRKIYYQQHEGFLPKHPDVVVQIHAHGHRHESPRNH